MSPKIRVIISCTIIVIGCILAIIAGVMAGNYPMGEMPALGSIVGFLGLMLVITGIMPLVIILISGGEE